MSQLYVLFEHSAGFALFKVSEFEELATFLPQVEASVKDLGRFNSVVKLQAFQPFKSAIVALENINSVSEGVLSDDLNIFLDGALPKRGKRSKAVLGVLDAKLGAAISEALEIPCSHTGAVPELIRGIRHHFHNMVKGLTLKACGVAQLGLGHSYSRARVKFNVHRVDNMIIQSIALLDQLDKDVNTFSMRIREWYSYHFPELVKIVPDNYLYSKCAEYIKDRKSLTAESVERLTEIVSDSEKAEAIFSASKMSMGMDISPVDLINIQMFASRVVRLSDYRKQIAGYLHNKMNSVAPNLAVLLGDQVGARLISRAGSLTSLAKYPASTLQILGAEKALFRALKTKTNTPKYGLLYHSTFIGRAGLKNKGRISRYLANKCSIASRIDCFSEVQSSVYGEKLREQVEDRLKFYESGDVPKKNIVAMQEAMKQAAELAIVNTPVDGESNNRKRKRDKRENANASAANLTVDSSVLDTTTASQDGDNVPPKKKKKDKKNKQNGNASAADLTVDTSVLETTTASQDGDNVSAKKKKKDKKNKQNGNASAADLTVDTSVLDTTTASQDGDNVSAKKKKKDKKNKENGNASAADLTLDSSVSQGGDNASAKKKKKNTNTSQGDITMNGDTTLDASLNGTSDEPKKKKKKKSKAKDE